MTLAIYHSLAIASLLVCLSLSACGEKAKTETVSKTETASLEALTRAFNAELEASLCIGGRKKSKYARQKIKLAGLYQTPVEDKVEPSVRARNNLSIEAAPNSSIQMDHSHTPVAVPAIAPIPQLSTVLTRDVMSGFNLQILTANYEMSPPPFDVPMEDLMVPQINEASGFLQGHAHLYINGEKIQRVYGNYIHIPASYFKTGMNQLNITINNHAHMFWTTDEKQIISSLFINTESKKVVTYQFDSFPFEVGKF